MGQICHKPLLFPTTEIERLIFEINLVVGDLGDAPQVYQTDGTAPAEAERFQARLGLGEGTPRLLHPVGGMEKMRC